MSKSHTTKELAEMPDDGYERWLVRGQIRTASGKFHTRDQGALTSNFSWRLMNWCDEHPELKLTGYICPHCRLARNPDTVVFANVAIAKRDSWVSVPGTYSDVIEGSPELLVDIVDARDNPVLLAEREQCYREFRVNLVWVVDPETRQVTVYENGEATLVSYDVGGYLGGKTLPGFALDIREVFDDE